MSEDALVAAIGDTARRLPTGQVVALANAIEAQESATRGIAETVASPRFRDVAGQLADAWEATGISGPAVALALRATATAVEHERAEESIDVVWTGPKTTAVPVRLTREVLIDVIRAARESLFIISFAAYKIDVVLDELSAAAQRGVVVRLVLETPGGTLYVDSAAAFESLRGVASFYVWPDEKRPALEGSRAQLHAKAAIADDHTAFVTSANLTGHGIAENMELGLLVKGGPIPRRLSEHFRELIAGEVLRQLHD
jgi:phosphatidylserine/phosphatidylglycerophosphate/cardiolipin synthase-like enzyme